MGQQLGREDQSRNRVVIGVTITNSVDSVSYLEYNLSEKTQNRWISHSERIARQSPPAPPFNLDVRLLEDDLLETALQKANPNKSDEDPNWFPNALDSDMVGPGFPSIMVGPNAGGKSVALNMIDTFHQLLAPLDDCIGSMVAEYVPAAYMHEEKAYGAEFDSDVWHSVSQSLRQWKWLGRAWSVKLDFAEYQSNPYYDTDGGQSRHPPIVDIEYFSTLMEFRSADDLDQIRLTFEGEGLRKRRLYINVGKYNHGTIPTMEDGRGTTRLIEGYGIGDISDISVIPSTVYRLLSGVGDNFLPITIVENGELWTHTSPKLVAMSIALETALELYYEIDDDDLDVGDIFRSQPCNFENGKKWNDVLDEGKYEDIQNEVKSCYFILRMGIRESGEDIHGFPRTLRIDTLRKSSNTEFLLTPTQNAVVEICTALNRVWKRTLQRMSNMSSKKTEYGQTADFEEFKHLARFGQVSMLSWYTDNPDKGYPNPKNEEELIPYWFPNLQWPYHDTTKTVYPPFDPSGVLYDDIRSHTPFSPNLPLGLIRDIPLSRLYEVAWRWSIHGVDLKELIDAHELLENSDFMWGDDRAFVDLFAKIKESFDEENGVKDVDDVIFSVFNHTARCLGEYAEIAGKLDTLSEKVSEYLGITVEVRPVIEQNLEEILEDPKEIDRIAGEMNLPYLSSGQAQLLTMLTQMELASPETRIILLDEPELSLHDKLIGDLYDYLCDFSKNNNKQVICSTHSTTLAGLGLRHTAFVDRIGDSFGSE